MTNIAYWLASKPAKPGFAKDKELVALGERIYRGGIAERKIAACAGCHSPNGAGIPSQYPRLSGQHADYTKAQLTAFRDGVRLNNPTDGPGRRAPERPRDPGGRRLHRRFALSRFAPGPRPRDPAQAEARSTMCCGPLSFRSSMRGTRNFVSSTRLGQTELQQQHKDRPMIIDTRDTAFTHDRSERDHAAGASTWVGARLIQALAGGVGRRGAWHPGRRAMRWPRCARPGKLAALPGVRSDVAGAATMEKLTDYKDASTYNNFYEFGTDKADPAKNAHTLKTTPWTVEVEGLVKKPGEICDRGPAQAQRAGGADLPPALCRRLVDGHSLGRLFAGGADPQGRAAGQCQVRRVRHAGRSARRCPASARACWTGPMSRACAWTRPCIR